MPTARRTIRIDEDLWTEAQRIAEQRGEALADVVRRSLRTYVRRYRSGSQASE